MLLTNVVVRLLPFQSTTAPEAKFEPFTVRVKSGAPAATLDGEIELIEGGGGGGGEELLPAQAIRRKAIAIMSELNMRFGTLRLRWLNDGLTFMTASRATRRSEGAADHLRWRRNLHASWLQGQWTPGGAYLE